MPEPNPQLEQELAPAAPVVAAPSAVGAAPAGAFSAPMAASIRAFSSGRAGVPNGFGTSQVSALQRSAGNQVVARLVAPPMFIARQPAPPAPTASPSPGPPPGPTGMAPPQPGTQTPNPPSAANPSSGINWESLFEGETPNIIRSFLEVARLYPGWGLLAGGAADLMNAKQDFNQIQGEDAPEIKAFMAGRHAVAILNNGLGHVIYVVQLVQDIATASVVGAEVDAVTIPLNELLLGIKVGVDSVQFLADFGLTCAAQYRSMKAPPGPAGAASRSAWDGMVANYEANLVGDLLTGIFDIIDLSSAGFANAGPVKQGARAVKGVFDTAKFVKGLIKSVLQGWFGVWGGKAFERGAPLGGVHGILERQAGAAILLELQQMKLCYTVGDALIGAAADHIAKQLAELNAAASMALNGRDPFVVARDAAVEGLGHVEQRIGDLTQMQALATTAAEKAAAIDAWATETRGTIDSVQVPDIDIPEADIGDDPLSDLAEGALNMAGDVAGAGLQLLVDQLNAEVDELKSMLTPPVDTIKEHATELGEFMQVVTNEAREQITSTQARVADIKAKLAKCNSFEDVVNMIIQQIFDMVGLESDFEVDDIRQLWVDVGGMIDEGITWATALASGQPTEPPAGAGVAGADDGVPRDQRAGPSGASAGGASGSSAPGGAAGGGGGAGSGGAPGSAGSVPAGAAAAAAASPPSAPPSGAAAGHDLEQPGAAAAAAGGAGGAPAIDPGAFTGGGVGAAAAGAAGAVANGVGAAAGAAGAAVSGGAAAAGGVGAAAAEAAAAAAGGGGVGAAAAGAAGAAAGGIGEAAAAAGGAAASAAGGVGEAVAGAAGGGMGGLAEAVRRATEGMGGGAAGGGGGAGGESIADMVRKAAEEAGLPEPAPGGGGGGGMMDGVEEMIRRAVDGSGMSVPGGGPAPAPGGGGGGGMMDGVEEMIRRAVDGSGMSVPGGGPAPDFGPVPGPVPDGGGGGGGGLGGGMADAIEMIKRAAEGAGAGGGAPSSGGSSSGGSSSGGGGAVGA